ncbi:MAG: hypothetical protein BWY76_03201 [bacterium ADurb.Bin429]|nr:MAG: hypothetical protein BWY76_03201 [bacterium ADurb.Bin429]
MVSPPHRKQNFRFARGAIGCGEFHDNILYVVRADAPVAEHRALEGAVYEQVL